MNIVKRRGRPTGWTKPERRVRKDYRFRPATLALLSQGQALDQHSQDETAYVEAAIVHYTALLVGTGQEKTEIDALQARITELQEALQQAKSQIVLQQKQIYDLAQEVERAKVQTQRKRGGQRQGGVRKRIDQEAQVTIGNLIPQGTMGSYGLKWEQQGLVATASLDPIDERSSAAGYRLDSWCASISRPGQPLGSRQQEQATRLMALAKTRLIEELGKAGWQPDEVSNTEKGVWRWHRISQ